MIYTILSILYHWIRISIVNACLFVIFEYDNVLYSLRTVLNLKKCKKIIFEHFNYFFLFIHFSKKCSKLFAYVFLKSVQNFLHTLFIKVFKTFFCILFSKKCSKLFAYFFLKSIFRDSPKIYLHHFFEMTTELD